MRRSIKFSFLGLILAFTPAFSGAAQDSGKVLFLGDSFSIGAFGRTLDDRMRATGLDVYTVVAGGASPYYWLGNYQPLPCTIGYWEKTPEDEKRLGYVKAVPKIENLIEDIRPDIVVVQTGVNLYATLRSKRRPKSDNIAEVRSLIDQMCYAITKQGAKGYWILPPHSHEKRYPRDLQDELATLMADVVKGYNGAVFESQKFTRFTDPYPSTDGIHYGSQDSRVWAERVAADFKVYLRINGSYAGRVPDQRADPVDTQLMAASLPGPKLPKGVEKIAASKDNDASLALDPQPAEVDLTLRLLEKSEIQNLTDVPYANALGVFEYEVVTDRRGNYPFTKIRVAHGIVFNRRHTSIARQEIGDVVALRLVPLSSYRSLQTWQTVDDLRPNFEMPLYTPKLD